MKVVVFVALMLMSAHSYADDLRFRSDTVVPLSVQAMMNETVQKECSDLVENDWPMSESRSDLYMDPPDTLPATVSYITTIRVQGMDSDNMHPYSFDMRIEATDSKVLSIDAVSYCQYRNE